MTENKAASKDPATLTGTEPDSEKASAVKQGGKKPQDEEKKKEEEIVCPINFEHLTMGALRKYQYRYKINMAEDEKNLITR